MGSEITYDQYDAMYAAYVEQQTEAHVKDKVGVSQKTAHKYVNYGDPDRGMPPIKDRWQKAMRTRQRKQDLDLSKAKDVLGITVYNLIAKIANRSKEIELAGICPSKLPRMLVDLQTVLRYVLGDSDVNVSTDSRFKKFDNMTTEEVLEYFRSGTDKNDLLSDADE